jgi:hypothetical protein
MAKRARYPSVSLRDAVSRVTLIYEAEGTNDMTNEVAVKHMGYSSLSGTSMSTLAALKKYGLLEGRGDDIHVTQDAVVIVCDKEIDDQSERADALRRSLSSDALFQKLLDRFGSKTTKLNVASYLKKKGLNPNSAESAAASFLDSVQFVYEEIGEYNSNSPAEPEREEMQAQPSQLPPKGSVTAPIVISGVKAWPQIVIPEGFTEKNWDDMMTLLKIMKPGLVTNPTYITTPNESDPDVNDDNDN